MPLANPWQTETGKRALIREEKTLKDERTGFEVTLCLEELDEPALGLAADLFEEYTARYLARKTDGSLVRSLPHPAEKGKACRLSRQLLNRIAMLQTQQRPGLETDRWPEGEGPAPVHWWYGVAERHGNLWGQIIIWAVFLGMPQVDEDGNVVPGTGGRADPNAGAEPPTTAGSAALSSTTPSI